MALLEVAEGAIVQAVNLINQLGATCYFTRKDDTIDTKVKALVRELGTAELVADYRQGDMKVEFDARNMRDKPKKYDVIKIDGKRYGVKDDATPRRVGDTIYTWRFIVRAQ